MLPARQERYVEEVADLLGVALGHDLLAVYLVGSGALGDWAEGRSDIDVMAICGGPLEPGMRNWVVEPLRHRVLPCPAPALELVIYSREAVRAPGNGLRFEVNLNTGPAVADHVSFDPGAEPAHWFVLDLAAARLHGRAIRGPEPADLIGPVPEPDLRAALTDSVRWHAEHEATSANAVLNACRSWRFIVDGTWSTKLEAGHWAVANGGDPVIVGEALALHAGATGRLDAAAVKRLLDDVAAELYSSGG